MEQAAIVVPVLLFLDPETQPHPTARQLLDGLARAAADLLETLTALTDEDGLLSRATAVDGRLDLVAIVLGDGVAFDGDGGIVGNFGAQLPKDLLTDKLRRKKTQGTIRQRIGGKARRSRRQVRQDTFGKPFCILGTAGAEGQDFEEWGTPGVSRKSICACPRVQTPNI